MDMLPYLQKMVQNEASDLFLTVDMPPCVRVHGDIVALTETNFSENDVTNAILNLMSEAQKKEYLETNECNFAIDVKELGRFRVSAFVQRNQKGCVIRHIQSKIPSIEELNLPSVVKALSMIKKGLIIVAGATGMGKTTTIASMLDCHNKLTRGHIITVEDPIEYLHVHKKCIVTQREVGIDTSSFAIALKNAMRQAPDVILVGEIRDVETMRHAISFAETGHLCLATLHASNTTQALERIAHFFPEHVRDQLWLDLSLNMRAILAQRLIKKTDGQGRVVAMEVMINTPIISECIRKGEIQSIREYIMRKDGVGMQTMDQALFDLYEKGMISEEEALHNADSANNMRILMKMKNPNNGDSLQMDKKLEVHEDTGFVLKGRSS
ncbi:MAG: PilT/PilU family type 4a pilus ATPase [Proteobacteria bacterium]|nr:PilT/PilU family type 4a pilus ATPase [Pseudomonadota bacterium]